MTIGELIEHIERLDRLENASLQMRRRLEQEINVYLAEQIKLQIRENERLISDIKATTI